MRPLALIGVAVLIAAATSRCDGASTGPRRLSECADTPISQLVSCDS